MTYSFRREHQLGPDEKDVAIPAEETCKPICSFIRVNTVRNSTTELSPTEYENIVGDKLPRVLEIIH
jgi:hypothetical protein